MAVRSLSGRLISASLAWSALALLATGIILVATFRQSIEQRFDQTLEIYLKALVAQIAQREPGQRFRPPVADLAEPRFDLPLSGWYWFIADEAGAILLASGSLAGDSFALPPPDPAAERTIQRGVASGPAGESLRFVARPIRFPAGPPTVFAVAADPVQVREDTARFGQTVILFLGLFAFGLAFATLLQVRIGLRPLDRMRRQLQAIRAGQAQRLEAQVPTELEPLASEFNSLIDSNRAVLERARHHVGNLAHALKTPLTVLKNEARNDDSAIARVVEEQTELMQQQVRHHLDRAQIAAKRRLIGAVTEVSPTVDRLVRVVRRLSAERALQIDSRVAPALRFAGEQQDLEEMLGNLLENAAKWADHRIEVHALRAGSSGAAQVFSLAVEDDGPGLSPAERAAAMSRGARLDETKPGSGLGLSIVNELAGLYGGTFALDTSPMGGLRAVLTLPLA